MIINPPDALAFIVRDVRWCQGNMQYLDNLQSAGAAAPVSIGVGDIRYLSAFRHGR